MFYLARGIYKELRRITRQTQSQIFEQVSKDCRLMHQLCSEFSFQQNVTYLTVEHNKCFIAECDKLPLLVSGKRNISAQPTSALYFFQRGGFTALFAFGKRATLGEVSPR